MGVFGISSSSKDKSHSIVGSSLRPSSSKYDGKILVEAEQKSLPNPNPINYKITKSRQVGDYLVIRVKYLDCTNYEGVKILVFKTTLNKLIEQKYIDPHFCENKKFISDKEAEYYINKGRRAIEVGDTEELKRCVKGLMLLLPPEQQQIIQNTMSGITY